MAQKYEQILDTLRSLDVAKAEEAQQAFDEEKHWLQDVVTILRKNLSKCKQPWTSEEKENTALPQQQAKTRGRKQKREALTVLDTVLEEAEEEDPAEQDGHVADGRQSGNDAKKAEEAEVPKEEPAESHDRQQTGRAKGKKAASKAPSKAKSRVKKEPQEEAAGPTVRVTRSRAAAATTTSAPSNDFPSPPKVRKTRSKKAKPSEEPEAAPQSLPVVKEEPEAEPETVEDLPKPLSQQPELRTVPETPEGALAETAVGPQEQPGDLTQQDETRESERVEEGNIRDAGDDIILDLSQATEPSETAEKPEALSGGAQQGKVANEAPLGPIVQTPQGPHIASAATRNASSKRRAASSVRPKARISIAPGSSIAERRKSVEFGFASPSFLRADDTPSPGQEVASNPAELQAEPAEQSRPEFREAPHEKSSDEILPESAHPAGPSRDSPENAAENESPTQAEATMSEPAVDAQPISTRKQSSDLGLQQEGSEAFLASDSAEPVDNELPRPQPNPVGREASQINSELEGSPERIHHLGEKPLATTAEQEIAPDEQEAITLKEQEAVASDQEGSLPDPAADSDQQKGADLPAAEITADSKKGQQSQVSLPEASSAGRVSSEGKPEVGISKSKASLASKEKKALPVSESARAHGPSLVTSHRSLIQPKPAAQTLHAAGKRAPEVEALKAAEASRRKEAQREAEKERQREQLKKQKADRMKHALQVKAKQEEAQKRAAEETRRREEAMKRREDEAAARRRAKEEADKAEREEKQRKLEVSRARKKQEELRKQEERKLEQSRKHAREVEIGKRPLTQEESEPKRAKVADIFAQAAAQMAPLKAAPPTSQLPGAAKHLQNKESDLPSSSSIFHERSLAAAAATPADVPESIEIAPYRSDGESSEDEDDGQEIPAWAQDANLRREIEGQRKLDPDELFQQNEKTCPLEEVFASLRNVSGSQRDLNRRTSTGNWFEDRVTWKEEMNYKKMMGYL